MLQLICCRAVPSIWRSLAKKYEPWAWVNQAEHITLKMIIVKHP
jgi:hypothetical protein